MVTMLHRVTQFMSHVTARIEPEEAALASRLLGTPAERRLFERMPVADRRHALDVVQRLLGSGHDDPDLLAAALLHDAAKGSKMRLWHRIAGVLMEAINRAVLERISSRDPRSWRYPFHLYLHHGPLSADAARAAGSSERAAAFIRGEVPPSDAPQLAALRAADEAS
jgi:hypothetical protein